MSFWERIKAFFAEEEEPPRPAPLSEWGNHELTIKCLQHINSEISRRCRMAEKQPLSSSRTDGTGYLVIVVYCSLIEFCDYLAGDERICYQVPYENFGYDRLTEPQLRRFAEALHQKLYGTYLNNPKIKFEYAYRTASMRPPYGRISVDITAYHPQLKRVNL